MYAFKFKNSSDILFVVDENTGEGYWKFNTGAVPGTPNLAAVLAIGNDAGGVKIVNVAAPVAGGDATNKTYVDGLVIDSIADGDTTHAPSRNAVFDADATVLASAKTYADGLVTGLLDLRGGYDPTATSDYPISGGSGVAGALMKGDAWYITVDGVVGARNVIAGDVIFCNVDAPGQTDANWEKLASGSIAKNNLNAVVDPSVSDDSSLGYTAGVNASLWFNTVSGLMFVATDITVGAAVWQSPFEVGGVREIRGIGNASNIALRAPNKSVFQGDDAVEFNGTYTDMSDKDMVFLIEAGQAIRRRRVADADDTLVKGDYYVVVIGITAARTITLPPIADVRDHTVFVIKSSSAVVLPIYLILLPDGAETIDGGSHYYLYDMNESITIVANSSTGNWEIISDYTNIEKSGLMTQVASGSVFGDALGDTAMTWAVNKSYATHVPLLYKIQLGSGVFGISVFKIKNSIMDLTGAIALVNVTGTREMTTDNNQAVIHPDTGDITIEITTAGLAASSLSVIAYGIRR